MTLSQSNLLHVKTYSWKQDKTSDEDNIDIITNPTAVVNLFYYYILDPLYKPDFNKMNGIYDQKIKPPLIINYGNESEHK